MGLTGLPCVTHHASHAVRQIEVAEFDLDPILNDGILVKNEYTAVSIGTEIYNWTHGSEPGMKSRYPRTTGYCNVGRAIAVGRSAE